MTKRIFLLLITFICACVNTSAQYEKVQFPVPDFSDNKNIEFSLPLSLEHAYKAMQKHLCSLNGNPSPQWKTKYRELLIKLARLQHEVIIADAGNLAGSGDEWNEVAKFFEQHEHIKRILKQEIDASADVNDKAFYRDLLESYSTRLNELNMAATQDKYGRGGRQIFAFGTLVTELKDSLGVRQMKHRTAIDARIKLAFEALSRAYDYLLFRGTTHLNNNRLKNQRAFPLIPISPLKSDPHLQNWGKGGEVEEAIARGLSTNGQRFSGFWLKMPEGSAFDLETQNKVRGGCRRIDNQVASNISGRIELSGNWSLYNATGVHRVSIKQRGEVVEFLPELYKSPEIWKIEGNYLTRTTKMCGGNDLGHGYRYRISEDQKTLTYEQGNFTCNGKKLVSDSTDYESRNIYVKREGQ